MKNKLTIDNGKKLRGEASMPLIQVKLTNDYLQKAMRVSPTEALAELIWNALDADAKYSPKMLEHPSLYFRKAKFRCCFAVNSACSFLPAISLK